MHRLQREPQPDKYTCTNRIQHGGATETTQEYVPQHTMVNACLQYYCCHPNIRETPTQDSKRKTHHSPISINKRGARQAASPADRSPGETRLVLSRIWSCRTIRRNKGAIKIIHAFTIAPLRRPYQPSTITTPASSVLSRGHY